ncbi:hypothetical protein BU24DRAFT_337125 [Aaosphaeria arxii CBS 175.79]|uniref:Uncharacterized protein n=1 Tax=Aaosphaeria arxii CBS 175.79 TaxID=1450172 RepID=A0A6A5YCE3_9PLEO|nr:uncharacterized protein BU24DRAFT_337125 [Aaosphaeria arxii CBS 175.79]KAF2022370.1 hypothetical protein BU24DRAFT_337125 [Aaosphaeria arxii CBS 175.79]
MCNGSSTRTSQGGSIAVLRPTKSDNNTSDEWRLLFSYANTEGLDVGTQIELKGNDLVTRRHDGGYWVVIHHTGDMSPSPSPIATGAVSPPPFLMFDLDGETGSVTRLAQKLDLGVGENGIVGRKVSVMTSSLRGPRAVAEGIIGWN